MGVHSGVTTVVDQGGPSVLTFPGFREYAVKPASTRVLAFISAYMVGGLEGHYYPELYRPDCIAVYDTVRAARENADLVRGVKGHAEIGGFTRWGDEAMRRAAEIGRALDLPLYIHFGQLWPLPEDKHPYDPDAILPEMLKILRPGDILAHPFTRHPGGFVDQHGKVHPVVREALARGLKTDVGHGSHFSFKMARLVLEAGIVPDTLGADMHGYNTTIPKPRGTPEAHPDKEEMHLFAGAQNFSLASAMTSMLALGLTLEQVVPMVTSNCAAMLGMKDEIGTLRPGVEADVSVLADDSGRIKNRQPREGRAPGGAEPLRKRCGGDVLTSDRGGDHATPEIGRAALPGPGGPAVGGGGQQAAERLLPRAQARARQQCPAVEEEGGGVVSQGLRAGSGDHQGRLAGDPGDD